MAARSVEYLYTPSSEAKSPGTLVFLTPVNSETAVRDLLATTSSKATGQTGLVQDSTPDYVVPISQPAETPTSQAAGTLLRPIAGHVAPLPKKTAPATDPSPELSSLSLTEARKQAFALQKRGLCRIIGFKEGRPMVTPVVSREPVNGAAGKTEAKTSRNTLYRAEKKSGPGKATGKAGTRSGKAARLEMGVNNGDTYGTSESRDIQTILQSLGMCQVIACNGSKPIFLPVTVTPSVTATSSTSSPVDAVQGVEEAVESANSILSPPASTIGKAATSMTFSVEESGRIAQVEDLDMTLDDVLAVEGEDGPHSQAFKSFMKQCEEMYRSSFEDGDQCAVGRDDWLAQQKMLYEQRWINHRRKAVGTASGPLTIPVTDWANGDDDPMEEIPEAVGSQESMDNEMQQGAESPLTPKISEREARKLARERTKQQLALQKEYRKLTKQARLCVVVTSNVNVAKTADVPVEGQSDQTCATETGTVISDMMGQPRRRRRKDGITCFRNPVTSSGCPMAKRSRGRPAGSRTKVVVPKDTDATETTLDCDDPSKKKQLRRRRFLSPKHCDFPGCEFDTLLPHRFRDHIEIHPVTEPLVCSWTDCTFTTNIPRKFRIHVEDHEGTKRRFCTWPGCTFYSRYRGSMDSHLRCHKGLPSRKDYRGKIPAEQRLRNVAQSEDKDYVAEFGPIDISFGSAVIPPKKLRLTGPPRIARSKEERREHCRLDSLRCRLRKSGLPCDDAALAEHSVLRPPLPSSYECHVCQRVFLVRRRYMRHLNDRHGQGIPDPLKRRAVGEFPCDQCSFVAKVKSILAIHKRTKHGVVGYAQLTSECAVCLQTFPDSAKLGAHVAGHRDAEDRLPCRFCEQTYQYGHGLRGHIARAHAEEDRVERARKIAVEGSAPLQKVTAYHCQQCDRYYASADVLRHHLRKTHRDAYDAATRLQSADKYRCDICQKMCRNGSGLRSHKKSHDTQYPGPTLSCRICSETFSATTPLNQHLQSHADANGQLQCPTCSTAVPLAEFSTHMRMRHPVPSSCTCEICGRVMKSRIGLLDHQGRKHGAHNEITVKNTCRLCGRRPGKGRAMRKHLATFHSLEVVPEDGDPSHVGRTYADAYGSEFPSSGKWKRGRTGAGKKTAAEAMLDDSSEESYQEAASDESD